MPNGELTVAPCNPTPTEPATSCFGSNTTHCKVCGHRPEFHVGFGLSRWVAAATHRGDFDDLPLTWCVLCQSELMDEWKCDDGQDENPETSIHDKQWYDDWVRRVETP